MALEQIGEVVVAAEKRPIQLNFDDSRFEIWVGGQLAFLVFRLRGTKLTLIHTEVPPALQHQGLGEALANAALQYARGQSLRVKVVCPFVTRFIAKYPEFQDLVQSEDE